MNSALLLVGAIGAELIATSCLKLSDGFSRVLPALGTVVGYAVSFFLLSLTLKRLEVGVVYAVWSGSGTAAMALIGYWCFDEALTPLKLASVALIVVGVIGLNIAPSTSA